MVSLLEVTDSDCSIYVCKTAAMCSSCAFWISRYIYRGDFTKSIEVTFVMCFKVLLKQRKKFCYMDNHELGTSILTQKIEQT